jgi:hypothetical protein
MTGSPVPTIEWWNPEQVTAWFTAALWVPHHVAALIACLMGFLLLWVLPDGPIARGSYSKFTPSHSITPYRNRS